MNNMTKMIPMLMEQFGDFTREAIKAIPQTVANILSDTEGSTVIKGGGPVLSFIGGTDLITAQHKLDILDDVKPLPSITSSVAQQLIRDVKIATLPQLEKMLHEAKRPGSTLYGSFTSKLRISFVIPIIQTWISVRSKKLKYKSAKGVAIQEIKTLKRRLKGYIDNIKAWQSAVKNTAAQRRNFAKKITLERAKWQNVSVLLGKRRQKYYDKYGVWL